MTWQDLEHKHIVKMLDGGFDGILRETSGEEKYNQIYIILEYVPGGDLFDRLIDRTSMNESIAREYMS